MVKGSRVTAAHPHPEIPKVPSPPLPGPHTAFTYQKLDFDLKIRMLDNETSSDSVLPQDIFTVRVLRT